MIINLTSQNRTRVCASVYSCPDPPSLTLNWRDWISMSRCMSKDGCSASLELLVVRLPFGGASRWIRRYTVANKIGFPTVKVSAQLGRQGPSKASYLNRLGAGSRRIRRMYNWVIHSNVAQDEAKRSGRAECHKRAT